ncbi:uncharacterized protein [Rutidosis leptorrhynchoides]|uniref:uncharacterized protein n=1 Tax=Rutidosis leptorrhynchoides TaxID=125765 RepID=UPI003A9A2D68
MKVGKWYFLHIKSGGISKATKVKFFGIMWLSTQDRMQVWYPHKMFSCALCGKTNDSVKHLFFQCDYSASVWNFLKSKLVFRGLPNHLPGILQDMAQYPFSNNIWCIINRIVIAAGVYFIWNERNCRLFAQKEKDAAVLCGDIKEYVRLELITFKVKKSAAVLKAAKMWDLQWQDMGFRIV